MVSRLETKTRDTEISLRGITVCITIYLSLLVCCIIKMGTYTDRQVYGKMHMGAETDNSNSINKEKEKY